MMTRYPLIIHVYTLPLPVPDLSSSEQEMDVNVVHSRQCHATKIVEQEKPVRPKTKSSRET